MDEETVQIEEWEEENNALVRIFEFDTFVEAVDFVDSLVPLAEEVNHHPDILIFEYNKVKVSLSTHDAGDMVTEKDAALAEKINAITT